MHRLFSNVEEWISNNKYVLMLQSGLFLFNVSYEDLQFPNTQVLSLNRSFQYGKKDRKL